MRTNVMTVVEDLLLYLLHFCSGVSLPVICCGGGTRTHGLWLMRPTSETISSTPHYIFVDPTGIEPVTFTLWVYCYYHWAKDHCVPGKIPTSNLRLRRPLLYAVELQGHLFGVPTRAWTGNPHIKSVVLYPFELWRHDEFSKIFSCFSLSYIFSKVYTL